MILNVYEHICWDADKLANSGLSPILITLNKDHRKSLHMQQQLGKKKTYERAETSRRPHTA